MKAEKISKSEAEKLLKSAPTRARGQWDKIIDEVKETKQPMLIQDITRGQAWSLKRKATAAGLNAKVLKGNKVLITP